MTASSSSHLAPRTPIQRVVVVGAGPAGIAAAISARESGAEVALLDDNASPGGQIWRTTLSKSPPHRVQKLFNRLGQLGVECKFGATVVEARPFELSVDHGGRIESIHFDHLVLCTGARELFLPFPGWTLPGVMGAGGAQALFKGGADFGAKRIVVSGSGPLLIAVGAAFSTAGADVVGVFEQAPFSKLVEFGFRGFQPRRFVEAVGYMAALGTTPYQTGTWVSEAHGSDRLEAVTLTNGFQTWVEPCDLLACGYGLVPNTELASLLGCVVESGGIRVDAEQRTSVDGIYAAGEPVGIGGLDLALAEGTVAGAAAAGGDSLESRRLVTKLRPLRKLLADTFALRLELLELSASDTVICRCEDVRLGMLDASWSAREAKLYTRIGMGPCQGRVCGAAARCLFGWTPDRVRVPLYPTEVNHLAAKREANPL